MEREPKECFEEDIEQFVKSEIRACLQKVKEVYLSETTKGRL